MFARARWLAGAAIALAPTAALAQAPQPAPPKTSDAAAPKKPDATVTGVDVVAAQPDVQIQIDRKSYTLGKDLQASTGSLADALRNLPSTEVDLNGNLTVRGNPNVTILIDGKPAPQFDGQGRADALQQLSADQFERVEVITNPSAALNPEGSGGVINLISKKSRGQGSTGSAYATAGTAGLKRAGLTAGYNTKKLGVTVSASTAYQRNKSYLDERRTTLSPAGGVVSDGEFQIFGRNLARTQQGRVNLSYQLDSKTQLTGSANQTDLLLYGYPFNHYRVHDGTGALLSLIDRDGRRRFRRIDKALTAGLRHSFPGEGHDLSLDFVRNQTRFTDRVRWFTVQSVPPTATPAEVYFDQLVNDHTEVKLAYGRPLPGAATLKLGYEWKHDDNTYDHADAFGPSLPDAVDNPALANGFRFKQTINAGYATFERPFGDLSVQAGLRLEDVRWTLDQPVLRQTFAQDYFRPYPTLHLSYKLDQEQKLSASYSRRVERPPPFLLNPLLIVVDPKNAQQGNADLQPQDTHSFELGWEKRAKQTLYSATLYYRRTTGEFSPVLRDVGGGAYVSSFENLGASQAAGAELLANGKLSRTLSYNLTANLYWNQIDAGPIAGAGGKRSAFGAGGRANLDWQADKDDLVQLNAVAQGRRLQAQGTQAEVFTLNLGWRRKLGDRLTATLTAQDVLASNRFKRLLETSSLRDDLFARQTTSRAVMLRLDYRFGGKSGRPAREPGFDYDAGAGAGQ